MADVLIARLQRTALILEILIP